jgi:hypothetical protein
VVTLTVGDYDAWRTAARELLARETPPQAVAWLPASRRSLTH